MKSGLPFEVVDIVTRWQPNGKSSMSPGRSQGEIDGRGCRLFGFSRLDQADQSWRYAKRRSFQTPQRFRRVDQTPTCSEVEHAERPRHRYAPLAGSEAALSLVDQNRSDGQRRCERNGLALASIKVLELWIDV